MKQVPFEDWLKRRRCTCASLRFENGRHEARLLSATTQKWETVPPHVFVAPEDEDRYMRDGEYRKHLRLPW